jgi:dienelactone hydrolase
MPAWAQPNIDAAIRAHSTPYPVLQPGQQPGLAMTFKSGDLTLKGVIYKPNGQGPFPAILYNHGGDGRDPRTREQLNSQPELAQFYNKHGFVFFHPFRRGIGGSPGRSLFLRVGQGRGRERAARMGAEIEVDNEDVVAALEWLKAQPFVDADRLIMTGVSMGGAQTLMSTTRDLGIAGFIPFAPLTAAPWHITNSPILGPIIANTEQAVSPILLIQAANDSSTGPHDVLGPLLEQKGSPNRSILFPSFGSTVQHAHQGFTEWKIGTEVWGDDVLAFIDEVFATQ